MKLTKDFKYLMKVHKITYADIGRKIDRSPATVKQRISTTSTFHKHVETYRKALEECIEEKEIDKKKSLEALNEFSSS